MSKRNTLRHGASITAFTIAMAMMAAPGIVSAQEATIEPGDQDVDEDTGAAAGEIVVSGYREALETSINLKRESPVIAEAFSSEDIGKLPDVSIAETLGRLPGLAVQRINGRAQSLSVRGLGPDYSTSLLNGRELVSSGDNRAVEYDQYPAELINQGIVYKTPYAGLIGQGLAGTVDLRTIRPLAAGERIISLGGRLEFNEDGSLNPDLDGWGYRATGTYVDQFAGDTLGIALGLALQSSPSQVERFNAWGYPEISEGDVTGGVAPAGSEGTMVLGGMKPFAKSVDLDRLGAFGTIEWEPTADINTSVDLFYADYRERIPMRGIEFPLYPGWGATDTITSVGNAGGFADGVTYDGVQPVVRNDYDRKDTETFAAGWNTKYENDDVLLNLDISYSMADRRLQQIESYSGFGYGANPADPSDTISYVLSDGKFPYRFTNVADYSDTNTIVLTDPRGWGGGRNIVQGGFINDTTTKDELWTGRFEVVGKVQSPFIKQLVLGAAYSDRTKKRDITQNFLSFAGGTSTDPNDPGAIRETPIPEDALLDPIDSLGFLGFGPQVAYDPFALIDNGTYLLTSVEGSDLPYPGDWKVSEKVWTGYVRADLDAMLGSIPMTGNIGGQLVFTDQSSSGFNSPGGIGAVQVPVTDGDTYADFLPSASLNFEVGLDTTVRLAAARTLARPRMDQLNASTNASIATSPQPPLGSIFSASGGNPQLRPYMADSVDLSFEHYFAGGKGYIAIAGYYKWLDDFVNPNAVSAIRDFSYLVPTLTPEQQAIVENTTTLGFVSGPDNTADGSIRGIEASAAIPFEIFTTALEGFGFQTSVAYTDSKLDVTDTISGSSFESDVPGLSKWVVNSTAFFEKSGFEARLSHRYRSSYLAEFIGISATRQFRQTYAESIFDGQIGYRFEDGSLEGLSLTLQALNLTDEPFISYQSEDKAQVIDYERYGRTYLVGASYRF